MSSHVNSPIGVDFVVCVNEQVPVARAACQVAYEGIYGRRFDCQPYLPLNDSITIAAQLSCGTVVGGLEYITSSEQAELLAIAVLASERGHGLGMSLMQQFEADCAMRGLTRAVLVPTTDAEGFYCRLGYFEKDDDPGTYLKVFA